MAGIGSTRSPGGAYGIAAPGGGGGVGGNRAINSDVMISPLKDPQDHRSPQRDVVSRKHVPRTAQQYSRYVPVLVHEHDRLRPSANISIRTHGRPYNRAAP